MKHGIVFTIFKRARLWCIGIVLVIIVFLLTTTNLMYNIPGIGLLLQDVIPGNESVVLPCVLQQPIKCAETGVSYDMSFRNPLRGRYVVCIATPDKTFSELLHSRAHKLTLRLRMSFSTKRGVIRTVNIFPDGVYDGGAPDGPGYSMSYDYDVPSDIPLNQEILCRVTVIRADTTLGGNDGTVVLAIRKLSNE